MKILSGYSMHILLICILFSNQLWSQEQVVQGTVRDRETHLGIPFGVVQVKGRNEGVYTDDRGKFSFKTNFDSTLILEFFCIGYKSTEHRITAGSSDSLRIELTRSVTHLREVIVRPEAEKMAYLGHKKQKHRGDCYQKYGEEDAVFLKADKSRKGLLKKVYIYITSEGLPDSKFRVHIYSRDTVTNKPLAELTDSNVIVHGNKGNEWVVADLSAKQIEVNDGVFISVEWITGFGNNTRSLQSEKHAEVTDINGQVLGLARNSWKSKRHIEYMYHRDAFHKDWGTRWGSGHTTLLCPMIYATYAYPKN